MDERLRFIAEYNEREDSFAELCRQFGISRKTGYKWVERYKNQGPPGLLEKPPVARHCPWAVAPDLVDQVVQARKEHPLWGPKKLRALLVQQGPDKAWPAASTIGDLLKRHGLIRPTRRYVRAPWNGQPLLGCQGPNDLWCADFKGDFALGDGTRCHPLTISDQFSRFVLKCEGLVKTHTEPVRRHFELAFKEYGLPYRMRTDNGPPFASVGPGGLTELSVWWIKLGIVPERIEPGCPQQNGCHERMHRTLKQEATIPPGETLPEQQRLLDRFRREFNEQRPHEALGQTVPAKHYAVSQRRMPKELEVPAYRDMETRWVGKSGGIKWQGEDVHVGRCLVGEPVGLEQRGPGRWQVLYGPVSLGMLREGKEPMRLEAMPRKEEQEPEEQGTSSPPADEALRRE